MITTARCVMCSDIATHLSTRSPVGTEPMWGGNPVCDICNTPPKPDYHSGMQDVEPWDQTPEEAHPYNEPGPARGI